MKVSLLQPSLCFLLSAFSFPALTTRHFFSRQSARLQVHVLNGQIPVRVENLEPPLLFFLVRVLVRIEFLDDRRTVEIIVRAGRVLETYAHPSIHPPISV